MSTRKPNIIAVTTTPGAHALKRNPHESDRHGRARRPCRDPIVDTLARPGGNVTGMSQMTSGLAAKRLELLKEAVPNLAGARAVVSRRPDLAVTGAGHEGSCPFGGRDIANPRHSTADDLPAAFEAGAKDGAEGLITTAETIFRAERARVTELAARHKLPAIYPYSAFAIDSGGLMAYDVTDRDLHRSAATYVDMILKGAKPSALPVQQPTKFRLVINLKTANALGLTIPPQPFSPSPTRSSSDPEPPTRPADDARQGARGSPSTGVSYFIQPQETGRPELSIRPQDRQGARSHGASTLARPRRRGDRIPLLTSVLLIFVLLTNAPADAIAQSAKLPRVGWLSPGNPESQSVVYGAFLRGMRDLGYIEGRDFITERRFWGDDDHSTLTNATEDLVRSRVDIIVSSGTTAVRSVQAARGLFPS